MIESYVSGGLCVLKLNAPGLNRITIPMLDQLRASLTNASNDDSVWGIVITGSSEHFSAGADVGIFEKIGSPADAVEVSRAFQEAFQAIEDTPKPVAAAVAGRVIGGALELAAACHVRVAAQGSRFSTPEVNLGINPGAGATQRLPRLVGLPKALRMLLSAEVIDADQALAAGLVDAVCPAETILEEAQRLLRSTTSPRRTSLRTEKLADAQANAAALEEAQALVSGIRPEFLAPRKILEAVKIGVFDSVEAGLEAERRGFAECMQTAATRSKIYLFFATRLAAKLPEAASEPTEVVKAGVVGMGSMGTGIAHALARAGLPVVVFDEDEAAVARGLDRIQNSVGKRVERGKLDAGRAEAMLSRISTATGWQDLAEADLVVEAVFEDVAVKRSVIEQLEKACSPEAILATNTSTLSLDLLADRMRHAERLVGMHFFNPAHRMPLVEVIHREGTSARVVATALEVAKRLRKTPVLVKNREGFLVNRLFLPYLKEAFWLLEEGAEPDQIDEAMVAFGFPMGPLALVDMAGIDILAATDRVLQQAFPRHGPLSAIVDRLVADGRLGQKTGKGVYKYASGDYTPYQSQTTRKIVAAVQRESGRVPRPPNRDEITQRLVFRVIVEAFYVIEEGLAQRPSDLDVAMVLGTGFPDFRGGVVRYAQDLGLDRVRSCLDALVGRCGPRFTPSKNPPEMKGA